MNRFKSISGYIWAIITIPAVLSTFINNDFWAGKLAGITGVEISPWHTGGVIAETQMHKGYRTEIHQPVFDGLIGERDKGFVQVSWVPEGEELPAVIMEKIDYNRDSSIDFSIMLKTRTNEAFLKPYSSKVISVQSVLNIDNGMVVRILLKNDK